MNKFYLRQRSIAVSLLSSLCQKVLQEKRPLDRELQNIFRGNRGWGSKDRRFYSETVFSFFRWYGWFRQFFVEEVSKWTEEQWNDVIDTCVKINEVDSFDDANQIFQSYAPEIVFDSESLIPNCFKKHFSGDDSQFLEFVKAQQIRPPAWLRCRDKASLKKLLVELSEKDFAFEVSESLPLAVKIIGRFNINQLDVFRQGRVEIQDFASQCIGLVANPEKGESWLDACCGAGGKSLQLAAMMKDSGKIVSCDIRDTALKELKKRAIKSRFRSIMTKRNDLTGKSSALSGKMFDGVLVDAPCSNSGTWRRNPALRWNYSIDSSQKASVIQLKILMGAAKQVKPGGVLVYSTCSASEIENQQVVKQFLENCPQFSGDIFLNPVTGAECDTSLLLNHSLADNDTMFVARFSHK